MIKLVLENYLKNCACNSTVISHNDNKKKNRQKSYSDCSNLLYGIDTQNNSTDFLLGGNTPWVTVMFGCPGTAAFLPSLRRTMLTTAGRGRGGVKIDPQLEETTWHKRASVAWWSPKENRLINLADSLRANPINHHYIWEESQATASPFPQLVRAWQSQAITITDLNTILEHKTLAAIPKDIYFLCERRALLKLRICVYLRKLEQLSLKVKFINVK